MLRVMIFLILFGTNAYANDFDDLMKSQDAIVNQHLSKIEEWIVDANHNAAKLQSQAELIIKNSKLNYKKDLKFNWLNDLTVQQPQYSRSPKSLYIFVSLSMPKSRLINLLKEATNYNGLLVLRGLKNNSYKETINFLQPIIQEGGAGIIIDPNLFKEYNINQVPVFILHDPVTKKYDQITGNISLKYALQEFATNGCLKQEAFQILGAQQ